MSPDSPNARLFINYRREDTAPYAGRLHDRLTAHFGKNQVFIDIDQIELGEDFVEVIDRKVGACDVAIVLIGPGWLRATDTAGQRRLDDEEDFVRMEIVAALNRKIRVIPVLVGGARMPRKQDLPEALAPLSRRNAIELSEARFHADVSRLVEAIERPRSLPEKKTEPLPDLVPPIAEPVPPVRLADSENVPTAPGLRPLGEPAPVTVALIATSAPPGELADSANLPKASGFRPPAEPPPESVTLIAEPAPSVKLADPENLPETSAPRPPAGQDQPPNPPPAPRPQAPAATTKERRLAWILGDRAPRSQARAATTKGRYLPWILLILGCFAIVAAIFGGILGYRLMNIVNRGAYLGCNGGILWFTSSVTEAEAKKLGAYLVKYEFCDGGPKGAQLKKNGSTYEFRAVIKKGTENEDSIIAYHKNLGNSISLNVFDGTPVVVYLCDEYLKTLRVIPP